MAGDQLQGSLLASEGWKFDYAVAEFVVVCPPSGCLVRCCEIAAA